MIEILRPIAAGDETNINLQIPDSGEHWDKVAEEEADNRNTCIVHNYHEYARDLYALPPSAGNGTINKVTLYFRVRSDVFPFVNTVKGVIKSDSVVTETAEQNPGADFGRPAWGTYSQEWPTNPADGQPWEWADIDALQIGVCLAGRGSWTYCTQAYVEVDYTPVAPAGCLPIVAAAAVLIAGIIAGILLLV